MNTASRQSALENKTVFISCVVPLYNEEKVAPAFIRDLYAVLQKLTQRFEIILIDDGSRDRTLENILYLSQEYNVKILSFSRNFGKEIALTAGLEHASGDVAILMDADFQHPTALLPSFLEKWAQGYDMVYGTRKDRQAESFFKRKLTLVFYWLMKKISKLDLPHDAGDFRLIDKKIIHAFKQFPERGRFMKGLYGWVGYKKIGIPFEVQDRRDGQSSWGWSRLTELAITGIISFSDIPLRIWSLIGFGISLLSLVYAVYIIAVTLIYGADLPGFPTLIVAIMFLGGIQLMSIGILGEYIARIFMEVKQRPKYLLQLKQGFDEEKING